MSDTLVKAPVTQISDPEEDTDPGKLTHIIVVPPHLRGKVDGETYVLEARINGTPVTALCGHTWVPEQDPMKYPKCRKCVEIYDERQRQLGRI